MLKTCFLPAFQPRFVRLLGQASKAQQHYSGVGALGQKCWMFASDLIDVIDQLVEVLAVD